MLIESILQRFSKTLNNVLAQDPDFLAAVAPLAGRCFCIQVHGLGVTFYLYIKQAVVELTTALPEQEPDVSIAGPPLALIKLLTHSGSLQATQQSGVRLQGDLHVARQLSELLSGVDVDWEGILAQYIGDMPAYHFGGAFRRWSKWRRRTYDVWQMALTEYLQEEKYALPTRVEVEHFLDRVDVLRDAVERLDARVARLNLKR